MLMGNSTDHIIAEWGWRRKCVDTSMELINQKQAMIKEILITLEYKLTSQHMKIKKVHSFYMVLETPINVKHQNSKRKESMGI